VDIVGRQNDIGSLCQLVCHGLCEGRRVRTEEKIAEFNIIVVGSSERLNYLSIYQKFDIKFISLIQ